MIVVLSLVAVAAVAVGLVLTGDRLARLHTEGVEAAEAGEWSTALLRFREVVRADAGYRDAEARLAEALDRATAEVAAGWFGMGSESGRDDERPRRSVYVDAFEIDRYEVTNAQYRRFLVASGRGGPRYWDGDRYPEGQADLPVVGVGWTDACDYCEWAGKRLPTEAEWEKACRGGDGRTYAWGEGWDPGRANVGSRFMRLDDAWPLLRVPAAERGGRPGLEPVGSHPAGASPYGVMDLAGNASEWLADWYDRGGYWGWPERNPVGLGPPHNHSIRGSGWLDPYGIPGFLEDASRCSARSSSHSYDDPRVGFRCARSLPPEEW